MVKIKEILFSTPMVQAILDGRKNMTRRTRGLDEINKNPDDFQFEWADFKLSKPFRFTQKSTVNPKTLADRIRTFNQLGVKCDYGVVGDILWVRETYGQGVSGKYYYKADEGLVDQLVLAWKPSIHMPFKAARIFLRVKSVRVERLQDISENDSKSEGVVIVADNKYKHYTGNFPSGFSLAYHSFLTLWKSINGSESWDLNPWVWVIEFERITDEQEIANIKKEKQEIINQKKIKQNARRK